MLFPSVLYIGKDQRKISFSLCLGVAGLVDSGETIENAALRELKEETGYIVNQVKSISPRMLYSLFDTCV